MCRRLLGSSAGPLFSHAISSTGRWQRWRSETACRLQIAPPGCATLFEVLATRFGLHAIDAVHDGDSGVMVALQGTEIVRVPLSAATGELKTVPLERYEEVEVFFG